ncbi:hypothetical protein BCR37DRAFT_318530 [Protomyces lactucae-debilis]|uniref:Zn(2)-C6 fungal-type domain-containing protein n=1 Tax=Protomyces lactucae-debilis TaxID=2754530 RepID=A0A1Y2FFF7_PROLT|nr:uncharacterized protein BCR37DRAFT_318530 [Protomyces lactucae-debilis]ORY82651.1 hypothetical protein BCR37DRAFT_318530 [Protomyces lactucae-debilis]
MNFQGFSPSGLIPARGSRVRSSSMASSTQTTFTDGLSTTSTNPSHPYVGTFVDDPSLDVKETKSEPSPTTADGEVTSRTPHRRRRMHSKSRQGCLSCKRRRVKCTENRPVCNECQKLGLECSWTPVAQVQEPPDRTSTACLPSLECMLLFNWTHSTGPSFYLDQVWMQQVPVMSFEHPHLLHALLSVSAAHQQYKGVDLQPKVSMPVDNFIVRHRQQSIKDFRRDLGTGIRAENADALFATALLLALQSFQIDPGSWTRMYKGVRSIAHHMKAVFSEGQTMWNALINTHAQEFLPVSTSFALQPLATGPCALPIGHLAKLYAAQTISSSDLFAFPALLSEQFLELVERDHQVALVVMYYYFLLVQRLEDVWWIGSFGRQESMRIWHLLDDNHRAYLTTAAQSR